LCAIGASISTIIVNYIKFRKERKNGK
jgi:hypothetical protein